MRISNRKKALKFKRIFFLFSIVIALAALALFLLDYTLYGLGSVGVFSMWYLYFHVADYQFIEYNDANGKILLRYFKAVNFGTKAFHSIEFPSQILQNAHFEDSIFGKLSDVTLIIRTKRGIAEYPSVSLSAVPLKDRKKIKESLFKIIQN